MTSELNEDDYITEFVSGSAKNYGYLTKQGKSCCKVRQFTLNYRGSWYLNYEVMKQNVLKEITDPLDEDKRTVPVTKPYFFVRFFMHACILGVPGVGISFLGVLRGAMSSCSFFFCFFALRLSKFSTISSVMALSSDSTSANYLRSCSNSLVC